MTKRQSWIIFWLLFGLYMFDYMDRMIIVSLFPYLQRDMGLTDAQCGLLMSSVYWSILIFSFPVSILVDRWSRTKSISIMATFWSMATLACAFTKNFPHLLGSSLAPIVIGQLSDTYGLDRALTILPIFAFLAGVLLFTGSFYYKKDLYVEHSEFQDTDFPDQRIGFNKKTR